MTMSDYDPDEATARQDLCRFLSACYYEPAPEFAEEKLFDSIVIAAARLHPDLAATAQKLREAFDAQDLQTLLVDYTRLFLGPIDALAKPYGTSWLPAQPPAEDNPPPAVLELYSEGGFDIDDAFQELPDHVAVELEFLYLLNFTQNQARQAGDSDALAASEQLQQRFLDEHLGAWIGPFAAAVQAGAETPFYQVLATLTERFVRMQSGALTTH
jgi:putative dimethyl sulfoxide reductase chaperone